MRRKDREITDIQKIKEILSKARYLHIWECLTVNILMLCRFITAIVWRMEN